jgi:sigma-B regulation protein RsbU (phosphoserine phosphatase)
MMDALNESLNLSTKEILYHMKGRVDGFVGSAPQFDDLTMLCIEYFGSGGQKPVPAEVEG